MGPWKSCEFSHWPVNPFGITVLFEPIARQPVEFPMNAKNFRARARLWWKQEIRPLLIMVLVLFSIRSSLADWNDVPTGSMRPTILEGDRVWVNKVAYDLKVPFTTWHIAEWSNPQRGDIVELRENTLILNGSAVEYQPIAEELLRDIPAAERAGRVFASEQLPGQSHAVTGNPAVQAMRSFAPQRVPEGKYFMMGDNRDDSFDSRFWGPVERKQIVGRATAVVMSLDKKQSWKPRWQRFFSSLASD